MIANLIKPLLVLVVFLVVMKNSERQFAIAKSVHNVEVGSPSIRGLQEVEDRCGKHGDACFWNGSPCCGNFECGGFLWPYCE